MARETDLQTATRLLKSRLKIYSRAIIDMVNDGPQVTLNEYRIRRNELLDVLAFLEELDKEIHDE